MAVKNPPFALQDETVEHPADVFRQVVSALARDREGVTSYSDLQVTQMDALGMGVKVAAGSAVVIGDTRAHQGHYVVLNDTATNVSLPAAEGNPRIDLIVAQVRDNTEDGGGQNDWQLTYVKGTAAGSPSPPALPNSCLLLAQVSVGAGVIQVVNANISDKRPMWPDRVVCTTTTMPPQPFDGQEAYRTNDDSTVVWDGATWDALGGASASGALGQLGYAQRTTDQTGLGTIITDLTSLTTTVTVGASRRIRIRGVAHLKADTASGNGWLRIYEGASQLQEAADYVDAAEPHSFTAEVIVTPGAGSHTYKLRANCDSGFLSNRPASSKPSFIVVEDIGSA